MSWPPETTPSAAPGPGRSPEPWTRGPGTGGQPGAYPPPGVYPPPGTPPPPGVYPPPGAYGTAPQPGAYPPLGGYGTGEVAGPYGPVPPARPRVRLWPPSRREWTTALWVIVALAVVGAAVAPLWVQLAPRLAFRVDQPGRALPVIPEAEEYIAADGRFVIITLIIGVLAALGCWLVKGSRGPWTLLALAVGGLLGAIVTWRFGMRLGTGYKPADLQVVGKVIYQPLALRAKSALVVEPVAAVIGYLLAVGFSSRNDLGRNDLGRNDLGRNDLDRNDLDRDEDAAASASAPAPPSSGSG